MDLRRSILSLPHAPAPEPVDDRRIRLGALGYPWLTQYYPRTPITEDSPAPEDWPDLDSIVDLLDI
jgi:hypothetical protein